MLATLLNFYEFYPDVLLSLKNTTRNGTNRGVLSELDFHGERQREILEAAQVYQIDDRAFQMLRQLSLELQKDGLDKMFNGVRFPFPAMLITIPRPEEGMWPAALITQDEDYLYTQVFLKNDHGLLPNLLVFESNGTNVNVLNSPTLNFARSIGEKISDQDALRQEKSLCFDFLHLAVGMSILFQHKAMLEREEVPAYPRPERRRAEKQGRNLPNRNIVKVGLGELGKRHVQASLEAHSDDHDDNNKRRAHWVQGHFMRNRAGGISWRNPHVRGYGPLIEQERHVSSGKS